MKEIHWNNNDFDPDLSDFDDHFPDPGDKKLYISVSTNELMEQCGHLLDSEGGNTGEN